MEMSLGSMFFYGGIAGLAVTVLSAIIAGITLGSGKRALRRKLYDEYGKSSPLQQLPSNVNINESKPKTRTRNLKKLAAGAMTTVLTLSIAVVVILSINNRPATADEMLSLGERYLLELQFEQALVMFLGVIEIDPMNARAYLGAAEAFIGLGQMEAAINILRLGYERTGDEAIRLWLMELEPQDAMQRLIDERQRLIEELMPVIDALDNLFVVDNVWLGISDIGEAIAAFRDHPYTTFYQDDRDIGFSFIHGWYEDKSFAFFTNWNPNKVDSISIHHDSSFLISNSLRMGDSGLDVLRLFGLLDDKFPLVLTEPFSFHVNTPGGRTFQFGSDRPGYLTDFRISYWADGNYFFANVSNGYLIHVWMRVDSFNNEHDSTSETHNQENVYERSTGETEPIFEAEQNQVVVPDLLGMNELEAREALDDLGLILLVSTFRDATGGLCDPFCQGCDLVFDQTPQAGTLLIFPESSRAVRAYIC